MIRVDAWKLRCPKKFAIRKYKDSEIKELAVSIRKLGQLSWITVYREEPRVVISGSRRVKAIRLINKGFTYKGKTYSPKRLKVAVNYIDKRPLFQFSR